MKTILLEDGVEVRVRRSRGRYVRLSIRAGGAVNLTLPYFTSYQQGLSFVRERRAWVLQKKKELESLPPSFLRLGRGEEFHSLKNQAFELIEERLKKFQAKYGVTPRKVVIRNQKTRWGSCSAKGTLSFHYRLLFLPEKLQDYVVVHELCHLRAFNHSPNFWRLVAQTFPDYRNVRRELKQFGSK